jgi:hypothetical protein
VIDGLRDEVHKAGKVTFGPRARLGDTDDDEEEGGAHPSMINLLSNLMEAQVLVVDDRFLNKEPFATDNQDRHVHVATTLNLTEDLRSVVCAAGKICSGGQEAPCRSMTSSRNAAVMQCSDAPARSQRFGR